MKHKLVMGNPQPQFDPGVDDTSSNALSQMYAQGFRHVRGLGYVKLENPPPGWEVDPHDIEGHMFERKPHNQPGTRVQFGERVFVVLAATVNSLNQEVLKVRYEDNNEEAEIILKGIKIGEDWIR